MEGKQIKSENRQVFILCDKITPRLSYTLDWIFNYVFQTSYSIVTTDQNFKKNGNCVIGYGNIKSEFSDFHIPDAGLLWENDIKNLHFKTGTWNDIPTLFHEEVGGEVPFDLFSAVFFLISRYEEYLPHKKDKHFRYATENSILFQLGCLHRPIVDEWLHAFQLLVEKKLNLCFQPKPFSFTPTYDIDIAFSYLHKGWKRTLGGFGLALIKGKFNAVLVRCFVLSRLKKDPFDCFDNLFYWHTKYRLKPIYFLLASAENSAFDKHNLPYFSAIKKLYKKLSLAHSIGLHPSYFSNQPTVFKQEKNRLEQMAEKPIIFSRQHYLKFQIPETYSFLIEQGIKEDFSLGYGSSLGFRAGTGRSFLWFDVLHNRITDLTIHPFCFMDTTAHFEMKLSAEEAQKKLEEITALLQKTNSQLVTIFHNFSLGTDDEWKKWSDFYVSFLKNIY